MNDQPDWRQIEECEQQRFDEWQELLKADPAYDEWLESLDAQDYEENDDGGEI